jgi:aminomethyltransferase
MPPISKKDLEWIFSQKQDWDVEIDNISDELSQIALQGPLSEEILQKLTSFDLSLLKFFFFSDNVMLTDANALISRSGYTGEDGFEIYVKNQYAQSLFMKIIEVGTPLGLKPAGLGCRDTLRFEANLPLYGNEITKDITPLEAGLTPFVKLTKADFIGKASLLLQKQNGLTRKLVGFQMQERAIPRHGYEVYTEDKSKKIGFVTTGYFSPTLKKNIGLALIDIAYSELQTPIQISIRNQFFKASLIPKNFYNKNYKKV